MANILVTPEQLSQVSSQLNSGAATIQQTKRTFSHVLLNHLLMVYLRTVTQKSERLLQ